MVELAKWYALVVQANFEKKVKSTIEELAEKKGLSDCFEEILVPSGEVTEIKAGQKVVSEERRLPGYVLVKMIANDETVSFFKDIDKVKGFLPPHNGKAGVKPTPITQREVDLLLNRAKESVATSRAQLSFESGQQVRVIEGHFADFTGIVDVVDSEKQKLTVNVMIFGRLTPVELTFHQVDKI